MRNYITTTLAIAILGGGGYILGSLTEPNQELVPNAEITAYEFADEDVLTDDITYSKTIDGVTASFEMRTLQPDATPTGIAYMLEDQTLENNQWTADWILDCLETKTQTECSNQIKTEAGEWKTKEISQETERREQIQAEIAEQNRINDNIETLNNFTIQ